jgi:hypothetical protein
LRRCGIRASMMTNHHHHHHHPHGPRRVRYTGITGQKPFRHIYVCSLSSLLSLVLITKVK